MKRYFLYPLSIKTVSVEIFNPFCVFENGSSGETGYNISLSHGMSSIAAFLIQLFKLNFAKDRTVNLLTGTVNYILDQITYSKESLSYFPVFSKESSPGNRNSRLGWCYGDLGIAHILWQAAIVLKNKELENVSMQILRYNTNRRDLKENAIKDAGLCHGSAGVSYIFWNLFVSVWILTNNIKILILKNYLLILYNYLLKFEDFNVWTIISALF